MDAFISCPATGWWIGCVVMKMSAFTCCVTHLACCWKSHTGESVFSIIVVMTGVSASATANDTQLLGVVTPRSVIGLPKRERITFTVTKTSNEFRTPQVFCEQQNKLAEPWVLDNAIPGHSYIALVTRSSEDVL